MISDNKDKTCDSDDYNTLRLQRLEQLLDSAEREEHFFFGTKLIVCFKLSSGVILSGSSRLEIDQEDFDIMTARQQCYDGAVYQLAQFEEYRVYWQNYHYFKSH